MDKSVFFEAVRHSLFRGRLTQSQVQGINAILDEAVRRADVDPRHVAYMLATAYHETGALTSSGHMMPTVESLNYTSAARIRAVWPSRFPSLASAEPYVRQPRMLANKVYNGRMGNRSGSDDGWTYRGRGHVHLTGRDNYRRASIHVGTDLEANTQLALDLKISVRILFDGMLDGWFTGQRLGQHIHGDKSDYVNARRIINALDQAPKIADYARQFDAALHKAERAVEPEPPEPEPLEPMDPKPPVDLPTDWPEPPPTIDRTDLPRGCSPFPLSTARR